MAKKKQEIQLMREIESQEEWEDVMGKEGLWVVDVFQEWSGPCDAMVSNFRRIKNELGDDLLHFAMAKADTIESLEKYRGSCEPCFLFFAAGVLVSYVHGANAPLILRTLTEQLAQEHKVVDGSAERKEVKDPFVANREAAEDAQKDEEEEDEDTGLVPHRKVSTLPQDYEEVEQGYTVAIIKPNVVAEGKVDEILAEMKAQGINVVAQEERQLSEDEAKEFYSHLKDEDYFNDLVSFMASGPSHVLVLTKGQEDDSIIKDWRDMLGPPTVEDAKESAPESLRAKYGQAGLMNALHGSDSKETAARELAFFFPHMHTPTMQKKKKGIQRTLALIRPDAFANNRDAILERIKEAGFQIALQKEVMLTKEQAEEFYKEHAGQPYYDELTDRMSRGPLLALGLAREDAVENWRGMLGPTDVEEAKTSAPDSLRAQFAVPDAPINQLHGSDSEEAAKKELDFFFPVQQTVAMIKPDAIGTKDAIIEKIHQAGFRIAARKETIITREIAESFYEDQKDKEYFNDLVEHMASGPTMFMVLSREDAVEGWRQEIGPTDPAKAKEEAPDSLRAQFGTDVLKNAVHGASSSEEVQRKIQTLFGSLEFNQDGGIDQEAEEEAEQQQQAEQQQEQAEQQQQPEQEAKAEEQEAQQAEQPSEAEGKAEGEGQSEGKPAEAEGEAAEKTEGEGEEKPAEQTADSAEKDESAEKTEGGAEEKPSEPTADTTKKDEDAGQAAQQKAADEQATQDTTTPEQAGKPEDTAPEQATGDKAEEAAEQTQEKAEEPKESQEAKVEEQETKVEEQETKAEEQETKAEQEPKAEEQKEGQAEGQQEEESKAEQKEGTAEAKKEEGTAEAKKEGEEGKTEA